MIIKSNIHNYELFYSEHLDFLNSEYLDGDVIIIDSKLYNNSYKIFKTILIESKEESKDFFKVGEVIQNLTSIGFKKTNRIFSIGGGVIQDISGFISSILYRGVDWYFIPTTLLSQGDSCIGGKTSINLISKKNQLGNFYPPIKICIDTNFIKTLPENQIYSGLGEMLHYFIFDSYHSFLIYKRLFDSKNYLELIKKSLEIKKSVIEIDEKEKGIRVLFNYGHTFGHAIESYTKYNIPHGIAVSYGMDISNYISYKLGFLDESIYLEIKETLKKIYLGFDFKINNYELYLNYLKKDKKNSTNSINPILIKNYGDLFQYEFTCENELLSLIKNYFDYE